MDYENFYNTLDIIEALDGIYKNIHNTDDDQLKANLIKGQEIVQKLKDRAGEGHILPEEFQFTFNTNLTAVEAMNIFSERKGNLNEYLINLRGEVFYNTILENKDEKDPKWKRAARDSDCEMTVEPSAILFLHPDKKIVDWAATLNNLKRIFSDRGYTRKQARQSLLRLLQVYAQKQYSLFKDFDDPNQIANALIKSQLKLDKRCYYRDQINNLLRNPEDDLTSCIAHLKGLASLVYPPEKDYENFSKIMTEGLISFVTDEIAIPFKNMVEKDINMGRQIDWELHFNRIQHLEISRNLKPRETLKFGRKVGEKNIKLFNTRFGYEQEFDDFYNQPLRNHLNPGALPTIYKLPDYDNEEDISYFPPHPIISHRNKPQPPAKKPSKTDSTPPAPPPSNVNNMENTEFLAPEINVEKTNVTKPRKKTIIPNTHTLRSSSVDRVHTNFSHPVKILSDSKFSPKPSRSSSYNKSQARNRTYSNPSSRNNSIQRSHSYNYENRHEGKVYNRSRSNSSNRKNYRPMNYRKDYGKYDNYQNSRENTSSLSRSRERNDRYNRYDSRKRYSRSKSFSRSRSPNRNRFSSNDRSRSRGRYFPEERSRFGKMVNYRSRSSRFEAYNKPRDEYFSNKSHSFSRKNNDQYGYTERNSRDKYSRQENPYRYRSSSRDFSSRSRSRSTPNNHKIKYGSRNKHNNYRSVSRSVSRDRNDEYLANNKRKSNRFKTSKHNVARVHSIETDNSDNESPLTNINQIGDSLVQLGNTLQNSLNI